MFLKGVLLNIPLAKFFYIAWRWRVKIKIFSAEVNLNVIKLQLIGSLWLKPSEKFMNCYASSCSKDAS